MAGPLHSGEAKEATEGQADTEFNSTDTVSLEMASAPSVKGQFLLAVPGADPHLPILNPLGPVFSN